MSEDSCALIVRENDKDRYLASLFAPDATRGKLLALYAFNVEVSRIARVVSEPQLGLVRQQWWLDTLATGAGGHPVAEALLAARFPAEPLRRLVMAREFDLFADPMPDIAALEGYLGETSSALIQLAALALDPAAAPQAAEAAGLAGVAYGLARCLAGPDSEKYLPPGETRASLSAHALKRLDEARQAARNLPKQLLPGFLPVTLTRLYLNGVPSQFRRQLRLWWAARRERF